MRGRNSGADPEGFVRGDRASLRGVGGSIPPTGNGSVRGLGPPMACFLLVNSERNASNLVLEILKHDKIPGTIWIPVPTQNSGDSSCSHRDLCSCVCFIEFHTCCAE